MGIILSIKTMDREECDLLIDFTKVKPEAPNEISDDDSDNNQSEYPVNIHKLVLSYDLLITWLILGTHQRIKKSIESTYINQLNQPRKPKQSEQFCHFSFIPKNELEWEHRDEVYWKPASKNVSLSNLSEVSDFMVSFFINIALEKVEEQVEAKHDFDY